MAHARTRARETHHHQQVYDVTKFIDVHPGGRAQLLIGVGRDVSAVFDTYHKESTPTYVSMRT